MPDLQKNIPLYLQITTLVKRDIVARRYAPGERVPSIRDMSMMYGVTPNTIQRAFQILEQEGLLCTERTSDKFVTNDEARIAELRRELLIHSVRQTLSELKLHGYAKDEIIACIESELNADYDE